jgi:hypothetical protein
MKLLKNIFIYSLLFLSFLPAYGQIDPNFRYPACFNGLIQRNDLSMYGDSRTGYRLGKALYRNQAYSQISG